MGKPKKGKTGLKGKLKGTPEFGATEKDLQKFTEKQLKQPLTLTLAALLKSRPTYAAVFISRWLNPGAPDPSVVYSAPVTGPGAPGLAKYARPLVEQELGGTEAELKAMEEYLESTVRPLLLEAIKAGIRCRELDMMPLIGKYMHTANIEMRNLGASEETLDAVQKDHERRGLKTKLKNSDAPSPTPLMLLAGAMDEVWISISGSVEAAKDTFTAIAENAGDIQEMKARALTAGETSSGLAAATDVDSLLEVLQITAESILGRLQVCEKTVKECVYKVRVLWGLIPPLESEEILGSISHTSSEVETALDDLRNTVLMHSDMYLGGQDFRLPEYLDSTRGAVLERIKEIEEDVRRDIIDLFKDIQAGYDNDRVNLVVAIKTSKILKGELGKVQEVLTGGMARIEMQLKQREDIWQLNKTSESADFQNTKPFLPVFACMSQTITFHHSFLQGHLQRVGIKKSLLAGMMQQLKESEAGLLERLVKMAKDLEDRESRKRGEENEGIFEGITEEVKLVHTLTSIITVMVDIQKSVLDALVTEENRFKAKQNGTPPPDAVNIKKLHESTKAALEAVIQSVVESLTSSLMSGGSRKMAVLTNMLNFRDGCLFLQTTYEEIMQEKIDTIMEKAAKEGPKKVLNLSRGNASEIIKFPSHTKTAINQMLLQFGRIVPEWHEMYVTESTLMGANREKSPGKSKGKGKKKK
ncbi:hypothetical protein CYMTET_31940 [Cymbomonas tetramitiformis]|uniref:Uncharacterized protein n=1 Tax=Cymbomonas tetramitiformis TaxID=36881 RepID=A0AAE0FG21_9CHLO|nr:hypothetical protein CYMTET_31940 [Cymbomonas tetramitiformis]